MPPMDPRTTSAPVVNLPSNETPVFNYDNPSFAYSPSSFLDTLDGDDDTDSNEEDSVVTSNKDRCCRVSICP